MQLSNSPRPIIVSALFKGANFQVSSQSYNHLLTVTPCKIKVKKADYIFPKCNGTEYSLPFQKGGSRVSTGPKQDQKIAWQTQNSVFSCLISKCSSDLQILPVFWLQLFCSLGLVSHLVSSSPLHVSQGSGISNILGYNTTQVPSSQVYTMTSSVLHARTPLLHTWPQLLF